MTDPPRLLSDFAPAPGVIKADYTDFVVEEIPLYPADAIGTHTYFFVEKAGLSTQQAVHDIARALAVRRHEIGVAGLKDARAVTRQWMSVEHIDPERVAAIDVPRVSILETTRHTNKLRIGHLKANHFVIRVRNTEPDRLAELQDALARLSRAGVPNHFGPQRFGYRGDTWAIGRALLQQDPDEAVDLLLGRPTEQDYGATRRARELYDAGDYAKAAQTWPGMFHNERRALKALMRNKGNRRRALGALDKNTRTFFISAYQSYLFNQTLARRLPTGLGHLYAGDLAWLHASGAVFRVEDTATEQPRADRLEISPSGPLFGYRMTEPQGPPAEIEHAVLAAENLTPEAFRGGPLRVKGSRRPLRFPPTDTRLSLGADPRGPYVELEFTLPRGCYATALLRELFELQQADGAEFSAAGTETP